MTTLVFFQRIRGAQSGSSCTDAGQQSSDQHAKRKNANGYGNRGPLDFAGTPHLQANLDW
jgi:hypothetical protein